MNKKLGYILTLVGAAGLALLFEPVKKVLGIDWTKLGIADTTLTIASVICAAVGIFIIVVTSRSEKQPAEVPIFHGKKVVGFRKIQQ